MALGLAALAMMVVATNARAAAIRFDNPAHGAPGHYEWPTTIGDQTHWLEVTLPATSQPGLIDSLTGLQQKKASGDSRVQGVFGGAEVELGGMANFFAVGVDAGVLIPSGLAWGQTGYINFAGLEAEGPPEGQPTYIGMRFDPGDGTHYGWVGGVRNGWDFEAFAWGYETDVGTPIPAGAPEPGALAMLAVGAAAVLKRRRRHASSQIDSQID
ncbi:MAG: PEP-CTERM sorting domain-containing protein [bacterium]|nr:PEP-CTERM sorting domain-containing protein [bacterium]